ncbi:MAG: tetratricopeptide repeat-containing glycosyltransferase family protein [Pelosinus sp.]|nr:tetratricopeptide repeat-containing glycosyltransferase family protein [Pelosinus sp.]
MSTLPGSVDEYGQAEDYFTLASQAIEHKDWDKAIAYLCESIKENADFAEAYHNLGYVFEQRDQLDEAEAFFRKAIDIKEDFEKAYYNLGLVYVGRRLWADAEFCFCRALELNPDSAESYNSLAILKENLYRIEEAEAYYRHALEINPYFAVGYYNLGILLKNQKRFAEAEVCVRQAVELCPACDDIELGAAFFYLLQGRYEEGWQQYEIICRRNAKPCNNLGIRPWLGENLTNCKVLLYYGKGLGDSLQFARYIEQVVLMAAETVLLVQEPLLRLLAENYSNLRVYADKKALLECYDYACSLQTMPIIFKSRDATIPCKKSYLAALPEDIEAWRNYFDVVSGAANYLVGIVWAGNPKNPHDNFRSIPIAEFDRLFGISDVCWFSLQVGKHADDCQHNGAIIDLSPKLTDFAQTAGAIHNLDLVITMDTSVAHLAGAMGKKTWLLLDVNSDWRWQLDREDSPWYASMRLFRQNRAGDWGEVLDRVADALVTLRKVNS